MLALLQNHELTRNLLESILDAPGGRRSVSRLARTCKALSEPSLNVLWKELDSMTPLLSLMPNNLFKRPRRPGLGFSRNPGANDWAKVIAYGGRVRKITYNEGAGNIHPSIFAVLEETKPQDDILPKLDNLVWKVETAEGLERSLLFLSPSVTRLTVEIGNGIPQDELSQFLTEIATDNQLVSLSISTPTRLPPYLPRILQSQDKLESVALMAPGVLSPSIGRWLSSMTTLKSLRIDVGDKSDGAIAAFFGGSPSSGMSSPDFVMTPDSHTSSGAELSGAESLVFMNLPAQAEGFRNLRHLSLAGEVTSVSSFLGRITSQLQHVELALDEPEEGKDWKTLWVTLSRQFKRTLRVLQITASGNSRFHDLIRSTSRGENAARRLPLDNMEKMPALSRLEIDLPESRVFYDKDLQHLSDMCPELEVLKLCPLSRWPIPYGPPKATLAGLAPLAANCKRLHSLSMPFHAVGSTDTALFDISNSSNALFSLHAGHAWVEDALHVSILLSHLAPHLENLRWFHERNRPGYVEAHDVGWQHVTEILPQLQQLRLHERSQLGSDPLPATIVGRVVKSPAPPPAVIEAPPPPKVVKVDRGVQARCPMVDIGVHTKVVVRHKGISTAPFQRSAAVDATPVTVDQGVNTSVQTVDEGVEARPHTESRSVGTEPIPELPSSPPPFDSSPDQDLIEFNEKIGGFPQGPDYTNFADGYLGRTASYVARAIRAVSPPVVLRLMDMHADSSSLQSEREPRVSMSPALLVLGGAAAVVYTLVSFS